jgi:hypothetical protein
LLLLNSSLTCIPVEGYRLFLEKFIR